MEKKQLQGCCLGTWEAYRTEAPAPPFMHGFVLRNMDKIIILARYRVRSVDYPLFPGRNANNKKLTSSMEAIPIITGNVLTGDSAKINPDKINSVIAIQ